MAVIDVGSSKVCCLVIRARAGRGAQILGRAYQEAEGLRAGEVVDADALETSILATLHEAEQQAGLSIRDAVAAMSGGDQASSFHHVSMGLQGRAVDEDDLHRLLGRARRAAADPQRTVLHALPLEVRVDDGRALRDPCGLAGQQLDILAHAVTARTGAVENLRTCLERCHLEVRAIVASSYASGVACLTPEERERGCLALDLGAGATGIAHFAAGRLALVGQVMMGGDHVTRDLSFGLATGRQEAERIKGLYGGVVWRACDDNTRIEIPLVGDHVDTPSGEVPRTLITQIVRARVEEIFDAAQERLRSHLEFLRARPPRSIVLTGGGSQLDGIDELAREMFGIPARRGRPAVTHGDDRREDDPCCATVSGALQLFLDDDGDLGATTEAPPSGVPLARLGRWIRESF